MNAQMLQAALVAAITDAEDVLALPGAKDRRRLKLTDIQRETMAQVIAQHLEGHPTGEVNSGPRFLVRKACGGA